jgi:hypothetical protein
MNTPNNKRIDGLLTYWKTALVMCFVGTVIVAEPVITCKPQALRGIPGEPLKMEIAIEMDHASPVKLKIPAARQLFLRTIETIPIQRTNSGRYIQKRIVLWQGLEAGTLSLTNIIFASSEMEMICPEVKITIDAIQPALPPKKIEVAE